MTNPIVRKLFGNLPPKGRGVYARAQSVEFLSQFDFIALNVARSDAITKAAALVHLGKDVGFYGFPSLWVPSADPAAAVAHFESAIDRSGASWAIADVEDGWRGGTREQATAVAQAIKGSIARGYRWGITSFPSVPFRETWAASGAWGTPQLYHPEDVRWFGEWKRLFGATMIIPSVSLYTPVLADPDYTFTRDNYPPYLASIPASIGAIGWTTDGTPTWMVDNYRAWSPWGNIGSLSILWVGAHASTPIGIIAIVLLILALVSAIYFAGKKE